MKTPKLTKNLKNSYKNLLIARENQASIREALIPIVEKFLSLSDFEDNNGNKINKFDNIYLIKDTQFDIYLTNINKLYIKNGYNVEKDYCPILIADSNYITAENKFINDSLYLTKNIISRKSLNLIENRNEYLKITEKLVKSLV